MKSKNDSKNLKFSVNCSEEVKQIYLTNQDHKISNKRHGAHTIIGASTIINGLGQSYS